MGMVYRARVALKNPTNGIMAITASLGKAKPTGGGKGRKTTFTTIIIITLVNVPAIVEAVTSKASDLPLVFGGVVGAGVFLRRFSPIVTSRRKLKAIPGSSHHVLWTRAAIMLSMARIMHAVVSIAYSLFGVLNAAATLCTT